MFATYDHNVIIRADNFWHDTNTPEINGYVSKLIGFVSLSRRHDNGTKTSCRVRVTH